MYFLRDLIAISAVLSSFTSARLVEQVKRDDGTNADACKSIIVAQKASKFCSSFVPIRDVTNTVTQTGTAASTTVTVTAPCTNGYKKRDVKHLQVRTLLREKKGKRAKQGNVVRQLSTRFTLSTLTTAASTTTQAAPTTTQAVPTTTQAAPTTTPKVSTTTAAKKTKHTDKCLTLPQPFAEFACEIVRDACIALVTPNTKTVTTFTPGPTMTGTMTVTPTCPVAITYGRYPSTSAGPAATT